MPEIPNNLVLFDGVCNLCTSSVRFIIRFDKQQQFRFASLQSSFAQKIIEKYIPSHQTPNLDSIIYIENEQVYIHSDAVLRIAKQLKGWPHIFWYFRWLPKFLRDALYRFIARNRFLIFGKNKTCMQARAELKSRFYD